MLYPGVFIEVGTICFRKPRAGDPHRETAIERAIIVDKPVENFRTIKLVTLARLVKGIQRFWYRNEGPNEGIVRRCLLNCGEPKVNETIFAQSLRKLGIAKSQLAGANMTARTFKMADKLIE